jgi:hypothetical protein
LRRIFVRFQGAPRGAYYLYVTFGATLKAGKKTSKIVDLFVSETRQLPDPLKNFQTGIV